MLVWASVVELFLLLQRQLEPGGSSLDWTMKTKRDFDLFFMDIKTTSNYYVCLTELKTENGFFVDFPQALRDISIGEKLNPAKCFLLFLNQSHWCLPNSS